MSLSASVYDRPTRSSTSALKMEKTCGDKGRSDIRSACQVERTHAAYFVVVVAARCQRQRDVRIAGTQRRQRVGRAEPRQTVGQSQCTLQSVAGQRTAEPGQARCEQRCDRLVCLLEAAQQCLTAHDESVDRRGDRQSVEGALLLHSIAY